MKTQIDRMYSAWAQTCVGLGIDDVEMKFDIILSVYSDARRHYHNFDHIENFLSFVNYEAKYITFFNEMRMAVFMHDIFLNHLSDTKLDGSDEDISADISFSNLCEWGVPIRQNEIISELIRSTGRIFNNQVRECVDDCKIFKSLDRRILSVSRRDYYDYVKKICKEYGSIPCKKFRIGRTKFLNELLQHGVYEHEVDQFILEKFAISNIEFESYLLTVDGRHPLFGYEEMPNVAEKNILDWKSKL